MSQQRLYRRVGTGCRSHQHGWPGPVYGQHFCRTAVAQRQVRGRLPERLRQHAGADVRADAVLRLLQRGTPPPVLGPQDAECRLLDKYRGRRNDSR